MPSPEQRRKLRDALIHAFPDKSSLEQLLDYRLDKNLNQITKDSNLEEITSELIKRAAAEGWFIDLVRAAQKERPKNSSLQAIAQEILSNHGTTSNNISPVYLVKTSIYWLGLLVVGGGLFATIHFAISRQFPEAFISLSLTVILTLFIVVANFFSQVLNRLLKKWELEQEQLASRFADAIWSETEVLFWKFTSPFKEQYYQNLIYKCRDFRTQGLKTKGPFTLDLEKVFVPLRIAPESLDKISAAIIQASGQANNHSIWNFLVAGKKEPAYRRIVIIGSPGSGKTTLLEHLTLTYAKNTQRRQHPQAPTLIPILLYLRDVQYIIEREQPSLVILLEKQKLLPSVRWFENILHRQQCLVMLDGLDEVADSNIRKSVSRWINQQMQDYPNAIFLLTSRPFGYKSAPVQAITTIVNVQPFNLDQMQIFIHNWYLQNEVMGRLGKDDIGVRQKAQNNSQDLINRIKNYPPLTKMALNPLLLTMIATVHCYRGALPGRRVELYAEICDVLLGKRQEDKGIVDKLSADQKKVVLQVLAFELMHRETREFTPDLGSSIIATELAKVVGSYSDSQDFIKKIETISGLLVEREKGVYEFAHKSFQEYLAAIHIRKINQEQILISNINNSWWDETIRLYAAQTDATSLIRAALATPTVNSLKIALDCQEEGLSVEPEVRQQLTDKLEAGLESKESEIFKLAVQVKLARRLSSLSRVDEQIEIDSTYVTCAEYQLFLQQADESCKPQDWLSNRFPDGNAKTPITKISWTNALAFCSWLNLNADFLNRNSIEDNGVYYYRLPTLAETQNYLPKEYKDLGCWTIDGGYQGEKSIRLVKNRVEQDYIKIVNELAAGNWAKAAQESVQVMLKLANREDEGAFDVAAIEKIPRSCLSTIYQLWVQFTSASGGSPCSWLLNASSNSKEIFSALVQKHHHYGIECSPPLFAFNVVTVNAKGQEIQWERRQAEYFTENLGNNVILEIVAIPGGTFLMGSPEDEAERYDTESPQHEVTVPPFFMGKYPVTQAQWRTVATFPQVNRELNPNPSYFKGDNLPVEQISWYEALEFCDRISKHTKRHYRLPSEAEWEYACRAGTTTPFHFGETITPELVNYHGEYTYGSAQKGVHREKTTVVGSFNVANAFGLYDMHGNVWEWCADCWQENYKESSADGGPWISHEINDKDFQHRMLRGGSWSFNPWYCRSACRLNDDGPDNRSNFIGFRVVVSGART
ncbi:SUMF1/EgtB/PvdO family nonheme iron enzyme [Aetokthonos hydrillicola Thurmond2011]|jgi:formylglycine-generating enzyme required for sulfatase activity/energy-coupling factor transporter ATP-binding protein EcfA2|uniref:SUMF1/EgtB/PvdO family nonheme iron enzyme n=1 Tax=Aetokthonos hydrillicola Thurmond2011 TaxID=2712845 RepID=A0AAP5I7C7_9CYAN|nr:SUMF1/EgtB/PvdO family nonheme iron enzyme [Aetokthonos hydrillicola]MBO3457710.1 SUMF1/EgtB/PvdO family nonheme iron enzyme [Aetokthonos hydrillicola CCALA 1050]MBW4590886.1 SUMF1/EgtB/PvdO family nonheme iron enzyme [Aetokthonos hydrillicola CCALA 1050]MDR9896201.1 SUMF1/EgtB/PvdO family nonheme iron enzyme [Aetokthonos hydrillicola Thurmond2011]